MADSKRPKSLEEAQDGQEPKKLSIVVQQANQITAHANVVRFRGRAMLLVDEPFQHYIPLHRERFDQLAYPILGGVTRSRMADVFAYLAHTAQDATEDEGYVLFGSTMLTHDPETHEIIAPSNVIWNMDEATIVTDPHANASACIWRSPFSPVSLTDPDTKERRRIPFVLQLAGGDEGLYDDIMQSLAPLIMTKKPDGVVWWVGDGANGKSTLMDAIYQIFPGQLSSINVKRLTDGRDTPSLNGTLGNIVKESSEGRVDDTEVYKNIGTHENFRVHKFHSQDDIEIRGNIHHIFSANNIPVFNDKGHAARRRTYVVPFTQRFDSDPTFEERTFTPTFFGQLIMEMFTYAARLRRQGYRYKWSAATTAAKLGYDTEANNAEEYARDLIAKGVVAFDSFNPVRMDYENWCADNGFVPLGVGHMRRAMQSAGFERLSARTNQAEGVSKLYRLPHADSKGLQPFGLGTPGMYTLSGFKETVDDDPEPVIPPPRKLRGDW